MVSIDRALDLLAERRRRYALYCLEDRETAVSVDDLAAAVARMETDGDGVSADRRERVAVALQHTHLPAVQQVEFVEYEPTDGTVRLTAEPPAFEAVLNVAEALEQPA